MKSGQKFNPISNPKQTYTADGFFGATGVEYQTSGEAAAQNGLSDDAKICIKIKETGGACHVCDAVLVK